MDKPTPILEPHLPKALERILDYLWDDEEAHYRDHEQAGLDGHIFESLVEVRRWLDEEALTVASSSRGGPEDD